MFDLQHVWRTRGIALAMNTKRLLWMFGVVSLVATWGCTGSQVKSGGGGKAAVPAKAVNLNGCIRGRVISEQGAGFSSVVIKTDPPTSPQVTNTRGFFEICYKQQLIDADMGESKKVSVPVGSYTLSASKEGYHSRPVRFAYKGAKVRLENIIMVEKTRPLPQVAQTKQKEQKRTSGLGGKAPIGE